MIWTSTKTGPRALAPLLRLRGFSLVEALVSLVICTIAIAALVRATGSAVRAAMTGETYNNAILLAETKLSDVRADGPSFYTDEEGEFDPPYEDFRWRVATSEFIDTPGLYTVVVEITLPDDGTYTITTFLYVAALYVATAL